MSALIAFTTVHVEDAADRLARALAKERLAACVSRVPGVVSIHRRDDKVEVAGLLLLLIKTARVRFEALRARVIELHP